jgi:hypothetical protein
MANSNFTTFFSKVETPKIKQANRGGYLKKLAADGYAYIASNGVNCKHKLICYNCNLITPEAKKFLGVEGKTSYRVEIAPLYWLRVKALAENEEIREAAKIKLSEGISDYIEEHLSDYTEE